MSFPFVYLKKIWFWVGVQVQCSLTFGVWDFFGVAESVEFAEPTFLYSFFYRILVKSWSQFFLVSATFIPRNLVESATFFPGIQAEPATFFWNPRAYVRLCICHTSLYPEFYLTFAALWLVP